MEKYALGKIQSIVLDNNGWVNPCFFVNHSFVFRFNARDPLLPKLQREKKIFDLLKNKNIPVPKQTILDESKELVPFDVLISEMLPGKNIEMDWPNLDFDQRSRISQEAGKYLSQLHSIQFDFFGELSMKGPFPKTKTWLDFLEAKLQYHLNEAHQLKILNDEMIKKFWTVFHHYSPFLQLVTTASLVHVDFHLGNLLHYEGRITGVLDFEWAFAGDLLYDYCQWYPEEENWPNSRDSFLKGSKHCVFSVEEIKRINIYQMLRNIELCSVAELHFSKEEAIDYRETAIQQMNHLLNA